MLKMILSALILLCSSFIANTTLVEETAYAGEQPLVLKFKTLAVKTAKDSPIADLSISVGDINRDSRNEVAISGNGYIQIYDWNGKTFETKWKSSQYSHQLGGFMTLHTISPLVKASYSVDNKITTDYLYVAVTSTKPGPITSDSYKIGFDKGKYETHKIEITPFNKYDQSGICTDGSSLVVGSKAIKDDWIDALYKWDGTALIEKWRGSPGTRIISSGRILSSTQKMSSVFLIQGNNKTGLLSCDNDLVNAKEVETAPGKINLWEKNQIGYSRSLLGFTRKGIAGELWSIQGSNSEYEYSTKLYVSQFDGRKFSPFSRATFKGVDSNMIFDVITIDVDNDGVDEILGVEERIRKRIPFNGPGASGDEGDTLLITSNLFLAKWDGKEYEVKWKRKAIDERVHNLAVGDVTGQGVKEILITDEKGFFYVFDMPPYK